MAQGCPRPEHGSVWESFLVQDLAGDVVKGSEVSQLQHGARAALVA